MDMVLQSRACHGDGHKRGSVSRVVWYTDVMRLQVLQVLALVCSKLCCVC